jgi:hypothetical protein
VVEVKTRKIVKESINKNLRKMVLPAFDCISNCYKDHSIDLLSIDRVAVKSLSEINDLGYLYNHSTINNFLCMSSLNLSEKIFQKIKVDITFERPTVFYVVSLSVINSKENDNLVALIFPINSKKKSLEEFIKLL